LGHPALLLSFIRQYWLDASIVFQGDMENRIIDRSCAFSRLEPPAHSGGPTNGGQSSQYSPTHCLNFYGHI